MSEKDTFLCGQFSTLAIGQQHRSGVCLETSDGLWFTSLSHHVHCLRGGGGGNGWIYRQSNGFAVPVQRVR